MSINFTEMYIELLGVADMVTLYQARPQVGISVDGEYCLGRLVIKYDQVFSQ